MYSNQKVFSAYLCEKITSWFKDIQGKRLTIVDFGSGSGQLTHFLSNSFFKSSVIGIDIDEEKIAKASQQFPNNTFIHAKNIDKYIQKHSCDLVIMSLTLHHIPKTDRKAFLDTARTLLKPDGSLIIIEFNPFIFFSSKEFCKDQITVKETCAMLDNMQKRVVYFGYPKLLRYCEQLLSRISFGQLYAVIANI